MPLPTTRELREILEYASPYPWRRACGCIRPARENATWSIAAIEDEGGQIGVDDDIDLLLLAPQLAEEVIRLREEIDRLKWYCLDSVQVAEAEVRLADDEREKARQEGRAEAYYSTYLQITQGQHKEGK